MDRRICWKMSNIPTILDTEQGRILYRNIKLQPNSNLVLDGYSVYRSWKIILRQQNRVFDDQRILWTKFYEYLRIIIIARNYGECSRQSSDDGKKTTDRSVRWLFWQEYGVFSRVRSARYDDRVAEIIIRDQHLEGWLLFKDAEQQISARSSSSRQRSFHSPCRCLFSISTRAGVRSLIQNLLCRYTILFDSNQNSTNDRPSNPVEKRKEISSSVRYAWDIEITVMISVSILETVVDHLYSERVIIVWEIEIPDH